MFLILAFAVFVSQVKWAFALHCDVGWTLHGSTCYWKNDAWVNHEENLFQCHSMGASMVVVKTKEVNDFLKSFIGGTPKDFSWLAGFRVKTGSKEFKWMDGTPLTFSDWEKNEPNDPNNPKPICLDIGFGEQRQWGDMECSEKRRQLCQKPAEKEPVIKYVSSCDCQKLTTDIQTLSDKNSKCTAEVDGLNVKNTKCTVEVNGLNVKNSKCAAENEELRRKNHDQEIKLQTSDSELSKLSYKLVIVHKDVHAS